MRIALGLGLVGLAYLLFWPVPVDPVAYEPSEPPGFTGDFAENRALDSLDLDRLARRPDRARGYRGSARWFSADHQPVRKALSHRRG